MGTGEVAVVGERIDGLMVGRIKIVAPRPFGGHGGTVRWHLLSLLLLTPLMAVTRLPYDEVMIVGRFAQGPVDQPVTVNAAEFVDRFGSTQATAWPAEMQARQFFRNGGTQLEVVRLKPSLDLAQSLSGGFRPPAISGAGWCVPFSDLGILLIPELEELPLAIRDELLGRLGELAETRHFILLLDPPSDVETPAQVSTWAAGLPQDFEFTALLYPQVLVDGGVFSGMPSGVLTQIGASGSTAALVQLSDASQGIWKAPAGISAQLDVEDIAVQLTPGEASTLNAENVCVIREIQPHGILLFGWRSRDTFNSDNRFLSVNRLRRWASHSLQRGLAGSTALASNNATLWSQLESDADTFLNGLFRDGALAGAKAEEAYFARCGVDTTTPADIAANRVNLIVGIAPLAPAEFQTVTLGFDTFDASRPVPQGSQLMTLPGEGVLRLFHSTAAGFTHHLETDSQLDSVSWTVLSTIEGDGGWRESLELMPPSPQFFRMRTE